MFAQKATMQNKTKKLTKK